MAAFVAVNAVSYAVGALGVFFVGYGVKLIMYGQPASNRVIPAKSSKSPTTSEDDDQPRKRRPPVKKIEKKVEKTESEDDVYRPNKAQSSETKTSTAQKSTRKEPLSWPEYIDQELLGKCGIDRVFITDHAGKQLATTPDLEITPHDAICIIRLFKSNKEDLKLGQHVYHVDHRDTVYLTLRAKEGKVGIASVRTRTAVVTVFLAANNKLERDAALEVLKGLNEDEFARFKL